MSNYPRPLSKSKLIAYRQCPRRLWLEIHRPELREDSAATEAGFQMGFEVGDIARQLYDPRGRGELIEVEQGNLDAAFARTQALLPERRPLFEAGFQAAGGRAFADVLLPVRGKDAWRMVEVKSSTSVKDYHRDDAAIQAYIARQAGLPLQSIALAHIDNQFVYPGGGDYRGLLVEEDLSAEAFARQDEVKDWIGAAQFIAALEAEPCRGTGPHCGNPFDCGFLDYCRSQEPQAEFPAAWLPNIRTKALKEHIAAGVDDLREVPDALLNPEQQRVKQCTLANAVYFDADGARQDLAGYGWPAYFLDFETTMLAVPLWQGTRPYRQIPFQFSLHKLTRSGKLEHRAFLDLTGNDPRRPFAEALLAACGREGPVFVYNQTFEAGRVRELAEEFPDLARRLRALTKRMADLLPVAQARYYHPSQQGSWSIKAVLPAVVPELRYDDLEGVQDGGMAMEAYREAIHPQTPPERREQIRAQLEAYCRLDTYAMVKLWRYFSGRNDLEI